MKTPNIEIMQEAFRILCALSILALSVATCAIYIHAIIREKDAESISLLDKVEAVKLPKTEAIICISSWIQTGTTVNATGILTSNGMFYIRKSIDGDKINIE